MRALMRSLAPSSFEDVAALVALYRPGPMAANMHNDYADRKNERKPVTYLHEDLKEVLGDTYGLMIYQESVMRVAQKVAGYSLAEADNLRKACGKKDRALIAKEREKFVQGCDTHGYGAKLGTDLFNIIEPFGYDSMSVVAPANSALISVDNFSRSAVTTALSDHGFAMKSACRCRSRSLASANARSASFGTRAARMSMEPASCGSSAPALTVSRRRPASACSIRRPFPRTSP